MTQERKRILAVILPHLLCELALQRVKAQALRAPEPRAPEPRAPEPRAPEPRASRARLRNTFKRALNKVEPPRAIVLTDAPAASLDGKTELDAVNSTAHQLGVRPRQTLAQARAII